VELRRDLMLDSKEVKLRRETASALDRMISAANKQGMKLKIISGFRDFSHQKKLYLEAIDRHGPKQNSVAAPGYSEHQLGTTIDISNTDRRYMLAGRFASTPEGRWLHDNAEKFGFRNSYTRENSDEVGYRPEPWHFRYVGVNNTNGGRTIASR
jgi:zinc D-Ala-D-Ala carboxypeptidase